MLTLCGSKSLAPCYWVLINNHIQLWKNDSNFRSSCVYFLLLATKLDATQYRHIARKQKSLNQDGIPHDKDIVRLCGYWAMEIGMW